jgi:hypothetical protein
VKVLLVNSKIFECGVYQYGKRIKNILQNESRYEFLNLETNNVEDFDSILSIHNPDIIIYNWHTATMKWLSRQKTEQLKNKKQLFIFHELTYPYNLHSDGYLTADMSFNPSERIYPLIRPIFDFSLKKETNEVPVIGSFGFGFDNKGFEKICELVSQTFNKAIIKLHITNPFFGDYSGNTTNNIIERCKNKITNPNVSVVFTTNFLSDNDILKFLNSNSLNVFLYDEMHGRGLSSVIDYAISVDTPLAVNNSYMFRHITTETPNISISNNFNLKQIMDSGLDNVRYYRSKWNNIKFRDNLYSIITNL